MLPKNQFLAVILQVTLSFVMSSRSGFIGNTSKLARDKSEKNRIWWRRQVRNSQLCMEEIRALEKHHTAELTDL